jgi:hypothetical protein
VKERAASRDELPSLTGRHDMEAGSGEKPCTTFCFLFFPEPFEILADRFDAQRYAMRELVRPSNTGDEIDGIALGGHWLLENNISLQPP